MNEFYADLNLFLSIGRLRLTVVNVALEENLMSIPSHSHGKNSYEIHYTLSGHGTASVNGTNYPISPRTLFLEGPGVELTLTSNPEDPIKEYRIYINSLNDGTEKTVFTPDEPARLFLENTFWFGQDRQNIELFLKRLFYELRHKQIGYLSQAQSLLSLTVVALIRNFGQRIASPVPIFPVNLENQKSYLLEQAFLFDYAALSLDMLASRLALSKRQTERVIFELYGKTFRRKKLEARMAAAALFLINSDLSIAEIAEKTGYTTINQFSSAFLSFYGKSARTYRQENRSKENLS